MAGKVSVGFDLECKMIPLAQLMPLRAVPAATRDTEKYKCIKASVQEVGIIEPLIVYPQKDRPDRYLLLDGAIRLDVLKNMGEKEALCLPAREDEAYTYNHKVNRLSPIQEHFMILKALENGVPEHRIASTLNVDVSAVRRKRDLLCGICREAVDLVKDKRVSPSALREIKRVAPLRQIEMVELMIAANNYSASYAKCLYAATPDEQKTIGARQADEYGLSPEDSAKMRRELSNVSRDLKLIEDSHGENVLNLVLSTGYLKSLLGNARVVRHLSQHYPDILPEFQKLAESPELNGSN